MEILLVLPVTVAGDVEMCGPCEMVMMKIDYKDVKKDKTYEELVEENKVLKTKVQTLISMVENLTKDAKKHSPQICPRCSGTGSVETYWDWDSVCPRCHGKGVLIDNRMR